FTRYAPGRIEAERRAADRDDGGVVRRVEARVAGVTGGCGAHCGGERAVRVPRRLAVELGCAPAVANHGGARLRSVVDRSEEVVEGVRLCLDEKDAGLRCDGVRPLDVERDLQRPAGVAPRLAL